MTIHQDVAIYDCALNKAEEIAYALKKDRGVWVQLTAGQLKINGSLLGGGDGVSIERLQEITITAQKDSDFLLFDLS